MNASSPPPPGLGNRRPHLPVQSIVAEAYRLIWDQRDELIRLGLLPALASFLLAMLANATSPGGMLLLISLLDLLPLTLFAVHWHRLVLLGPEQSARGLGLKWESRETRFLVLSVLVGLGIGLVLSVPALLAARLLQSSPLGYAGIGLLVLASLYLWLRLGLIFPAIAIDHAYRLAQSWRDTAGRGLQFLTAVIAASLPVLLCVHIFLLLAAGTGLDRAAPLAVLFLSSVGSYLSWAAALTVIALVFHRLTGWSRPSTPVLSSPA